jgi:hypothetical protein
MRINIPNIVFVVLSSRNSVSRYNDAAFYYAEMTKGWANWETAKKAATSALADYMKEISRLMTIT